MHSLLKNIFKRNKEPTESSTLQIMSLRLKKSVMNFLCQFSISIYIFFRDDTTQTPCETCGRLPHPVAGVRSLAPELQDIFPVIPPAPAGKPKKRRVVMESRIITSEEWTQKLVGILIIPRNIHYTFVLSFL